MIQIPETIKQEVEKLETIKLNREIKTKEDYHEAEDILKQLKTAYKTIENKRKELTRPLDESKRKIMEFFKPPLKLIKDRQNATEYEMRGYLAKERAKKEEAEKKIKELRERALNGDEKAQQEVVESIAIKKEEPTRAATRTIYTFEITDVSQIPREYLIPNEKLIGEIVRQQKEQTTIPGIKVVKKITIVSR